MLIYWLLLLFPSVGAMAAASREAAGQLNARSARLGLFLFIFWMFYNAVSALRFNTGGDWYTYNIMVETIRNESLEFALNYGDIAFDLMIWVFTRIGLDIYGINALCSMILSVGVIQVARRTPEPWLAVSAAVPYLLIVVGLGYIRQGAAIGFILLAINSFSDRRNVMGVVLILGASLFHVAAIVVLPVIGLALANRNPLAVAGVIIGGLLIFGYVLSGARLQTFQQGYIERGYSSGGALIRLIMNVFPASLFLIRSDALNLPAIERRIWMMFSIAALICFVAYFVSPSSTVVDRVGLFFSPIQVFMFGYFLKSLREEGRFGAIFLAIGLAYCFAVQFIWLFYAAHSDLWVPYRSVFDRVPGL